MSRIEKAQAHCRAGYTAVDVLVVLLLIGIVFFFLLMAMPRGREAARLAGCQKNLAQIGLALGLYDQTPGLPTDDRRTRPDRAARHLRQLRASADHGGNVRHDRFRGADSRRSDIRDIPGRRRRDLGTGIRLQERRQRDIGSFPRR